jgi:ribosomal-protein-alanine N-acetyltransferase
MSEGEIRKPAIQDINQVIEIEQSTFPDPWSQDIFLNIILNRGRIMIDEDAFINMWVLDHHDSVIGYIIWEEITGERHGHLLNIAIREDKRSKGFGKALLRFAFSRLRDGGMETCELEVRESNQTARSMYTKAGMMAVDRVPSYYGDEDAIIYYIEF